MITPDELAAVNVGSVDQMLRTGLQWLDNTVHGMRSVPTEDAAIEAVLYHYVLSKHTPTNPILTESQLRHIHSRLTEL